MSEEREAVNASVIEMLRRERGEEGVEEFRRVLHQAALDGFEYFMRALQYEPEDDPLLRDTPKRAATLYRELTTREPLAFHPSEIDDDAPVRVTFDVRSLCSCHLMPMIGRADLYWLPGGLMLSLSDLNRVVDYHAHAPQHVDRLAEQLADSLTHLLAPRGAAVRVAVIKMCQRMRSVYVPWRYHTVLRGELAESGAVQNDALATFRPMDPFSL